MRTHIQIPEIHPANVGGRSKQGALKCPIVPGFVPICRQVSWNLSDAFKDDLMATRYGVIRDGSRVLRVTYLQSVHWRQSSLRFALARYAGGLKARQNPNLKIELLRKSRLAPALPFQIYP